LPPRLAATVRPFICPDPDSSAGARNGPLFVDMTARTCGGDGRVGHCWMQCEQHDYPPVQAPTKPSAPLNRQLPGAPTTQHPTGPPTSASAITDDGHGPALLSTRNRSRTAVRRSAGCHGRVRQGPRPARRAPWRPIPPVASLSTTMAASGCDGWRHEPTGGARVRPFVAELATIGGRLAVTGSGYCSATSSLEFLGDHLVHAGTRPTAGCWKMLENGRSQAGPETISAGGPART
jgi:hypothetical protein